MDIDVKTHRISPENDKKNCKNNKDDKTDHFISDNQKNSPSEKNNNFYAKIAYFKDRKIDDYAHCLNPSLCKEIHYIFKSGAKRRYASSYSNLRNVSIILKYQQLKENSLIDVHRFVVLESRKNLSRKNERQLYQGHAYMLLHVGDSVKNIYITEGITDAITCYKILDNLRELPQSIIISATSSGSIASNDCTDFVQYTIKNLGLNDDTSIFLVADNDKVKGGKLLEGRSNVGMEAAMSCQKNLTANSSIKKVGIISPLDKVNNSYCNDLNDILIRAEIRDACKIFSEMRDRAFSLDLEKIDASKQFTTSHEKRVNITTDKETQKMSYISKFKEQSISTKKANSIHVTLHDQQDPCELNCSLESFILLDMKIGSSSEYLVFMGHCNVHNDDGKALKTLVLGKIERKMEKLFLVGVVGLDFYSDFTTHTTIKKRKTSDESLSDSVAYPIYKLKESSLQSIEKFWDRGIGGDTAIKITDCRYTSREFDKLKFLRGWGLLAIENAGNMVHVWAKPSQFIKIEDEVFVTFFDPDYSEGSDVNSQDIKDFFKGVVNKMSECKKRDDAIALNTYNIFLIVLVVSIVGVVNKLSNNRVNFCLQIFGHAGVGKSELLYFIGSMFGCSDSLIRRGQDTIASLDVYLSKKKAIPLCIDELEEHRSMEFLNLIKQICNGWTKNRAQSDCSERRGTEVYACSVVTAEFSLRDVASKHGRESGVLGRILEMELTESNFDVTLFCEQISDATKNFKGQIGEFLNQLILKKYSYGRKKNVLRQKWIEYQAYIAQQGLVVQDNKRLLSNVSSLWVASDILNEIIHDITGCGPLEKENIINNLNLGIKYNETLSDIIQYVRFLYTNNALFVIKGEGLGKCPYEKSLTKMRKADSGQAFMSIGCVKNTKNNTVLVKISKPTDESIYQNTAIIHNGLYKKLQYISRQHMHISGLKIIKGKNNRSVQVLSNVCHYVFEISNLILGDVLSPENQLHDNL